MQSVAMGLCAAVIVGAVAPVRVIAAPPSTSLVSVSLTGGGGNGTSESPAISADGRMIAYHSAASNLVSGDTNGVQDIFVYDRETGQTTRVSVSSVGVQGNARSTLAEISADGRFVAFQSDATNLDPLDTNLSGLFDIFVHDLETGETTLASISTTGATGFDDSQHASLSADGRYVAFSSEASEFILPFDTNGITSDIFVHDLSTGSTTVVNLSTTGAQGNAASNWPSISADGRFVAYESVASNLVPGDTNGRYDIFIRDRQIGETTRVSLSSAAAQGNGDSRFPRLSPDGRFVAFHSLASNLVPGDTNSDWDIFLHDRQTGETTRVSVSSAGVEGNGSAVNPTLSADGRLVAFHSGATNLIPSDTNANTDVFLHDRQTGETTRVSVSTANDEVLGFSLTAAFSDDGGAVVFGSSADELVPGVSNGSTRDIFIRDLGACTADLNADGVIDGADLGALLGDWGQPGATDLNGDGVTDGADLGLLLGQWGACV